MELTLYEPEVLLAVSWLLDTEQIVAGDADAVAPGPVLMVMFAVVVNPLQVPLV